MAQSIYNPGAFSDDLNRVVQAGRMAGMIRVCLLTTRDREHALNMVKKTAVGAETPLYHFTVAGRRRYNPGKLTWEVVGNENQDAFSLLRNAREVRGGGIVVLEDCVPFLRDEGGDLRMRTALAQMICSETRSDGIVIVFMEAPESAGRLPAMLADQFVRLDVPYPRIGELEILAREEIAKSAHRTRNPVEIDHLRQEASRLAAGMVGLTRTAARDSLRDALAPDPTDFTGAIARLEERKSVQLSRELAMNVLSTEDVEAPVGLDFLVQDLQVMREKMHVGGPDRARGILLIGPPGTGKTMLARTVGKIVDLPVVEFKISRLMSSLLGETERRFSQAFSVLESLSPNIVFIDEIEKAFGDSSERDGGTMMRCTGALLSWLSDNPYPNFIVATSNNLGRMGEVGLTMTRSERFDAAYFVDLPCQESRRRMLERWLKDSLEHSAQAAVELAAITEKFSGADLRSIVKKAKDRADYQKAALSMDLLRHEAERKRMRAIALYDQFQELREWGRRNCDPAGPMDA
jgi:hypothetical protein